MPLPRRTPPRLGGLGTLALALALGACADAQALAPLLESALRPEGGRPQVDRSAAPASPTPAGRSPQPGTGPTPAVSTAPAGAGLPSQVPTLPPTPTPEGADWPVVKEGETEVLGAGRLRWFVRKQGDRYGFWLGSDLHGELTVRVTMTLANASEGPSEPLVVVPPESEGQPILARTWAVDDPKQAHSYRFDYRFRLGDFRVKPDPKTAYALPLPAGLTVPLLQGWHGSFSHQGENEYAVDFPLPEGTPVRAAREGVVVALNDQATEGGVDEAFKAPEKTNWVRVRHDDGSLASYLHLRHLGVQVGLGQRVSVGEVLGRSGNTGFSSRPHLHFEVHSPQDAERGRSHPFLWQVAPPPAAAEAPEEGRDYTGR